MRADHISYELRMPLVDFGAVPETPSGASTTLYRITQGVKSEQWSIF